VSKLTLSVDENVVARAKRYASRRGVSVSSLVETYLENVTRVEEPQPPPILKSLRGSLKGVSEADYRRFLSEKHR
jgi:hypothetical protein